jgi:hypothetical protein
MYLQLVAFVLKVMKNGQECSCYEKIPLEHLQMAAGDNEEQVCNVMCKGGGDYNCGGSNGYTVYVACKTIIRVIIAKN